MGSANFTSANTSASLTRACQAPQNVGSSDTFNFTIDSSLPLSSLSFAYGLSSPRELGEIVYPIIDGLGSVYYEGTGTGITFTLLKTDGPTPVQVASYQANVWDILQGNIRLQFLEPPFSPAVLLRNSEDAFFLDKSLPNEQFAPERALSDYSTQFSSVTFDSQRLDFFGNYSNPIPALTSGSYQLIIGRDGAFPGNVANTGDVITLQANVAPVPEPSSFALAAAGLLSLAGLGCRRFFRGA